MDEFNETDFRGLDLNILLTFVALMRTRSVKRAAERLFLGAPAVSMALGRLRAIFDDPLLVRTRDGMQPTPRALTLYQQIEPALSEIHRTVLQGTQFDPAKADGLLRLGIEDDLEPFMLPILAKTLAELAPGLRLVNRGCTFRSAGDMLDHDVIDLAFCTRPPEIRKWHVMQPVIEEGFLCMFDASVLKPATRSGNLTRAQYFSTPHVIRSTDGGLRTELDDKFEEFGYRRTVAAASATLLAAAMSLRGNRLLANLPALAARLIAREFGLALSALPVQLPNHESVLLCHAKRAGDPKTLWFRSILEQTLAALGKSVLREGTRR